MRKVQKRNKTRTVTSSINRIWIISNYMKAFHVYISALYNPGNKVDWKYRDLHSNTWTFNVTLTSNSNYHRLRLHLTCGRELFTRNQIMDKIVAAGGRQWASQRLRDTMYAVPTECLFKSEDLSGENRRPTIIKTRSGCLWSTEFWSVRAI